jgi:hypothetical protein
MPMREKGGYRYLIIARDNFSEWVKARPLVNPNSKIIAKFLWEDVVCRHEYFERLIINKGSKNKDLIKAFTRRYNIKRIQISTYYSQINDMIEKGYRSLINALSKMTNGKLKNWIDNLPAVL